MVCFGELNHLSIQLSNQAMARGLALADACGAASLEQLIELLLLEADIEPIMPSALAASSAGASTPAPQRIEDSAGLASKAEAADGDPGIARDFVVNPPALTLDRPATPLSLELADAEPASVLPLPFLTNRLGPLKASVRALANLAARDGEWPRLRDFQAKAGHAARERGLQLQAEDRAAGRRARLKRSVAWPIGANPAAALERFAFAFTLGADGPAPVGPLATLGLASLADGRVLLTRSGWELVVAPSPVLDGGEGTLGSEEIGILRACLLKSSPEREAVAEFIQAVSRAAGVQPRIDELLGAWHSAWSADQAAAQRSAMIGRLEELGVLDVSGRGAKAVVALIDVDGFGQAASERSAA
jgi:hypothetical protein